MHDGTNAMNGLGTPAQSIPDDAFSSHFIGTDVAVREVLADLRRWLTRSQVSADAQGTVELVLAEALNNVVEHAYADTTAGLVQLDIWHRDTHLEFKLNDRGTPMPNLMLPAGSLPDADGPLCDLPEGGFGWFLIHRLTHELSYARDGEKNCVCFKIMINDDPLN